MTIAATSPAVLSGPTTGPSHAKPKNPRHLVGGHHEGPRDGSVRCLRGLQVSLDALHRFLQLLDRTAPGRQAHVGNLCSNIGPIAGQVLDQRVHLPGQTPGGKTEGREDQRDDQQHGGDPANPPLQPRDGRRQDECEQDGERERHEDGLCPVQNGDHEHATGERHPGLYGFQAVVQVPTPFLGTAADRVVPLTW